ncbi:hypothetical protein B9G55_09720 [Saccharibacillus sp. O16]|nr:hypothetical protein B9G55_09720 [Saccharibacillus sp. O16]
MTRKPVIEDIALGLFASEGFEGASLGRIADAVGIRKPSIYAHFRSKEDLFLSVFDRALTRKRQDWFRYALQGAKLPLEDNLHRIAVRLLDDYESDTETRFLLRMFYFPPSSLHDDVMNLVKPFFEQSEQGLTKLLQRPVHARRLYAENDAPDAALSYITVLDGLIAEAIYGDRSRAERRLRAVWPIYCRGILKP